VILYPSVPWDDTHGDSTKLASCHTVPSAPPYPKTEHAKCFKLSLSNQANAHIHESSPPSTTWPAHFVPKVCNLHEASNGDHPNLSQIGRCSGKHRDRQCSRPWISISSDKNSAYTASIREGIQSLVPSLINRTVRVLMRDSNLTAHSTSCGSWHGSETM
jgi:hypothetical protein